MKKIGMRPGTTKTTDSGGIRMRRIEDRTSGQTPKKTLAIVEIVSIKASKTGEMMPGMYGITRRTELQEPTEMFATQQLTSGMM
jgi:hypothetical protein